MRLVFKGFDQERWNTMANDKATEGLLNQPVNDRYNDGSDKREKGIGYRKKEIGPEQSDTPTNKPEQFVTMKITMKSQAPQTNLHMQVKNYFVKWLVWLTTSLPVSYIIVS